MVVFDFPGDFYAPVIAGRGPLPASAGQVAAKVTAIQSDGANPISPETLASWGADHVVNFVDKLPRHSFEFARAQFVRIDGDTAFRAAVRDTVSSIRPSRSTRS